MAALTSQLDGPERGKRIIEGDPASPSFLGGLARLGAQAISGAAQMVGNERQRRASEADAAWQQETRAFDRERMENQRREWQRNDRRDAVLDEAAGQIFTAQVYTSQAQQDTSNAYNRILQVRRAQTAGLIPGGSLDVQLQAIVSDLFTRYPDMRNEIATDLQSRGVASWMFRDLANQRDEEENVRESRQSIENAAIEAFRSSGASLYNPDGTEIPREDMIRRGQQYTMVQNQAEIARQAATAAREAAAEGRTQSDWEQGQQRQTTVAVLRSNAALGITQATDQIRNLFRAAGGNQANEAQARRSATDLIASLRAQRTHYQAALGSIPGATSTEINDSLDYFDDAVAGVESMVAGPVSQWGENQRAYTQMQQNLQISADNAAVLYNHWARVLGRDAVNGLFGDNPALALPASVQQEIRRSLANAQLSGQGGRNTMQNLTRVISGQAGLRDMTSEEAVNVLPGLVTTARTSQAALLRDPNNDVAQNAYMRSYGEVSNAASEIQPGSRNTSAMYRAAESLFTNDDRRVLRQLVRSDPESGRGLARASRITAAHLLETARTATPDTMGFHTAYLDRRTGTYGIRFDRQAYERAQRAEIRRAGSTGAGPMGEVNSMPRLDLSRASTIPRALQERVNTMNLAIQHLVQTSDMDVVQRPAGVTPLQEAMMWATGQGLPTQASGAEGRTSQQAFNEMVRNLRTFTLDFERQTETSPATSTEGIRNQRNNLLRPATVVDEGVRRGYPRAASAGIAGNMMAESGGRLDRPGDGGRARSAFQWHPDRQANARRQGFDLSTPEGALNFAYWELENGDAQSRRAGRELRNPNITPERAAEIFALYFERPRGAETGDPNNIMHIDRRRRYARQAYGRG